MQMASVNRTVSLGCKPNDNRPLLFMEILVYRLLVEEFRKTLVELRRSKTALSPASLFAVIWKVVPTFRFVVSK